MDKHSNRRSLNATRGPRLAYAAGIRAERRERARVALMPILGQLGAELALFIAAGKRCGFGPAMREQWAKVLRLEHEARECATWHWPFSGAERAQLERTAWVEGPRRE